MAVDTRVEKIKASLIEISEWASVYLHRNTDRLLRRQENLQSSIGNLEKCYDGIKLEVTKAEKYLQSLSTSESEKAQRMDQDNLENLRRSLDYLNKRPQYNLTKWSSDIQSAFYHDRASHRAWANYPKLTLESLQSEDYFKEWNKNQLPKLLLLGGTTNPESRSHKCNYSWVSTAAADIANSFRREGKTVAFFTCHPEAWNTMTTSIRIHDVIAGILFQIAGFDPPMLRDELFRHSSRSLLTDWKAQDDPSDMVNFARKSMEIASEKHPIYIILDRMDACGLSHTHMSSLELLKQIVASTSCKVKLLTTWDTIGDSIKGTCEDFSSFSKGLAVARMGLDQAKSAVRRI